MHALFILPPTTLGDFYRIQEKSPKSSVDKCTEHATQKIRSSKRLGPYILLKTSPPQPQRIMRFRCTQHFCGPPTCPKRTPKCKGGILGHQAGHVFGKYVQRSHLLHGSPHIHTRLRLLLPWATHTIMPTPTSGGEEALAYLKLQQQIIKEPPKHHICRLSASFEGNKGTICKTVPRLSVQSVINLLLEHVI